MCFGWVRVCVRVCVCVWDSEENIDEIIKSGCEIWMLCIIYVYFG